MRQSGLRGVGVFVVRWSRRESAARSRTRFLSKRAPLASVDPAARAARSRIRLLSKRVPVLAITIGGWSVLWVWCCHATRTRYGGWHILVAGWYEGRGRGQGGGVQGSGGVVCRQYQYCRLTAALKDVVRSEFANFRFTA